MSIDGQYKFHKLYIDNVDSTIVLDTMGMTGKPLITKNYDTYEIEPPRSVGGCKLVSDFTRNFFLNTGGISRGDYYMSYAFDFKTDISKVGNLFLYLSGFLSYKDGSTNLWRTIKSFQTDYCFGTSYSVKASNDSLSFTTNDKGREIKFVLLR